MMGFMESPEGHSRKRALRGDSKALGGPTRGCVPLNQPRGRSAGTRGHIKVQLSSPPHPRIQAEQVWQHPAEINGGGWGWCGVRSGPQNPLLSSWVMPLTWSKNQCI